MTIINPKSIAGVTSITTPSGSDNLFTVHTNNTTERVRINNDGDVIVGSGITVSPDGDIFATGVTTATTFVGALTGNVTGNATGLSGTPNISAGTIAGSTGTFTGDVDIADKIVHTGDTDTAIRFPSADAFTVETGGTERLRINSTGQTIVGDSVTQLTTNSERPFQVHSVNGPKIAIGRNDTSISEGNTIGGIEFYGNDANGTFVNTASIIVDADGAHGDDDKPTRMEFYTTADGGSSASERLRIQSDGEIFMGDGFGSTNRSTILSICGAHQSPSGVMAHVGIYANDSQAADKGGSISFGGQDGSTAKQTFSAILGAKENSTSGNYSGYMSFFTRPNGAVSVERMRIDSAGKVFIATTTRGVDASASNLAVYGNSSTTTGNVAGSFFGGAVSSARHVIVFSNSTGVTGSIATNGSQTDYNTSSDYRLKENTVAISDGITRLKTLKPIRFNFIKDASTTIDGFLAHEVSDAIPAAVTGEKDGMAGETFYEEGDTLPSGKEYGDVKTYSTTQIEPQQLDQSKLVPLLTAALQEAITKIEVLETRLNNAGIAT